MAIPDWITIATSDKSGGTGTSSTTKSISIKASENKSLSSRTGTITFKPSHGNSKTVSITQNAGVYSFGALSSSLTYSTDTVPASGGTLSSYTIWWSLPYGWNESSSNAGTMNSSNYTNYSGVSLSSWSWSSSNSNVSVSSNGKVTIQSAGTTHYADYQQMAKITATATLTIAAGSSFGNSSAISFTVECVDYVFREANPKTLVEIRLEPYQPDSTWLPIDSDGNWSICPAGNSYTRAGKRYVYSFPSGASEVSDFIAVNLWDDLEWSDTSWIERYDTTGIHIKSRETIIGDKRSTTATLRESGFTVSRVLTQEANTLSYYYFDPVVSLSCQDIPASGGSISSGSVSYSQKVNNDYTSGSQTQSTLTSGGTISYSSAVSAGNLGTTTKARSSVGTLTATVTMNGKSGSKSTTVYQEANTESYVYGDINIAGYYDNTIPASGGTGIASAGVGEQTIKTTYTSGSSKEETNQISVTDRYLEVENVPSLGTTIKERTLLASKVVTFTGQGGKSASHTICVYQEANKIESTTYGEPMFYFTPAMMLDVPASGAGGNIQFSVNQNRTYTYTSEATSTSLISPSYTTSFASSQTWATAKSSSTGFTITIAKNDTTSSRSGKLSVIVTANGVTGAKEFEYSQLAGASVTTLASDPSSLYTSYAGDIIEVVISMEVNGAHTQFDSEEDLIISSYPSWVTKITTVIDTGDIVLAVFVAQNSSTSQRSGSIVIRMADGSASLSIPISQGQASASTSSNYSKIWFAINGATSVPSMMYENLGIICSDYENPDYGDYDCVPIGTYLHGSATFNNRTMICLVSSDTLKAVNVKESISMLDDSMDIYLAAFPDGFSETAQCIARIDSLLDIIKALDDVAANGDTTLYVSGALV